MADGGAAVALAEMALASGIGAIIDQPQPFGIAGSFFGEDQGLYVVTVRDESLADFLVAADKAGLAAGADWSHDRRTGSSSSWKKAICAWP